MRLLTRKISNVSYSLRVSQSIQPCCLHGNRHLRADREEDSSVTNQTQMDSGHACWACGDHKRTPVRAGKREQGDRCSHLRENRERLRYDLEPVLRQTLTLQVSGFSHQNVTYRVLSPNTLGPRSCLILSLHCTTSERPGYCQDDRLAMILPYLWDGYGLERCPNS